MRFVKYTHLQLLALVLTASIVHAQNELPAWTDQQLAIIDRIDTIEKNSGPNTAELIGVLQDLAIALEAEGNLAAAVTVVERIRQLTRINFGPHSLRQAPYIEQLIDYREHRGDFGAAWALENELLDLAMRDPDSLDSVPILQRLGDKRMDLFREFISGPTPPQIYLGCYYDWTIQRTDSRECLSGSRKDAVRAVISDAQRIYASAVSVLLNNGAYTSDELFTLESKFLRSNYAYRNMGLRQGAQANKPYPIFAGRWNSRMSAVFDLADWDFPDSYFQSSLAQARPRQRGGERGEWHHMDDQYVVGRLSLQRRLAYTIESQKPLRDQVHALVEIADWDLLHGRNSLAIDGYELAYNRLADLSDQRELLEMFFSPETPVALPTFLPNPLTSTAESTEGAYIDVQFSLSRYGRGQRVKVIAVSPNFPEPARSERGQLIRRIKDSHFRPRTVDGRFVGSAPVAARYFLADAPQ